MADLNITAANVLAGSNAVRERGTASVAITAGQALYKDATSGKFGLLDADHATAGNRKGYGVALNSAAADQPVEVQRAGEITLGAVLTAGQVYVASGTAGAICPVADLATGDAVTILGVAKTASVLDMGAGVICPNVVLA